MRMILKGLSALTALTLGATTAHAQNVTFESILNSPNIVGGVGDFGGASWTQSTTVTTEGSGTSTSTSACVGMEQPSGSLFDRHVTCTSNGDGGTLDITMGCMKGPEGSGEMSCAGYVVGRTGAAEGHRGIITQHFNFEMDGSGGTSTGTGQWTR